jgi:hypothetical protein
MKTRFLILALVVIFLPAILKSQPPADDLVSGCVLAAGQNVTYLKDFRVQLPKAPAGSAAPVHKTNMYLMKNIKYRFSLCNSHDSKGDIYLIIYDQGKELISSFNKSSGKKYSSVDFFCNKTGLYNLWYSFINGEQGSGVGVVSMIR